MRFPVRPAALLAGLALLTGSASALADGAPLAVAAEPPSAAVAAPAAPPERHDDPVLAGLAATFGVLTLADVGFGVYDAIQAGRGAVPPRGAAYAEIAVAVPQSIVFGAVHAGLTADAHDNNVELAPLIIFPGLANTLLVHGAFSAGLPTARPGIVFGTSCAIGFDSALTVSALGASVRGHLFPRTLGAVEMVLTAPQIAVASYASVKEPHTPGWTGLAAWSGSLFAHGLLSTLIPRKEDPPPEPPPQPEPSRPPLLVPGSLDVAPMPVAGGAVFSVRGRWN
jgi:hypothetical protein